MKVNKGRGCLCGPAPSWIEPRGPWARACGVAVVTTDLKSPLERPQLLPPRVQILLCVSPPVWSQGREKRGWEKMRHRPWQHHSSGNDLGSGEGIWRQVLLGSHLRAIPTLSCGVCTVVGSHSKLQYNVLKDCSYSVY